MKRKQLTYCYCKCGTELIKAADVSFVNDVYVECDGVMRNVVHYNCPNCRMDNYFDFDFPTPMPLPLNDDDNVIEVYLEKYIKQ